jgi:hypothetical protein
MSLRRIPLETIESKDVGRWHVALLKRQYSHDWSYVLQVSFFDAKDYHHIVMCSEISRAIEPVKAAYDKADLEQIATWYELEKHIQGKEVELKSLRQRFAEMMLGR